MGIHSKLAGLQLFLADDTFNGHARLALIEHNGLRMEDAPPVFYGSSQKTDNKAR